MQPAETLLPGLPSFVIIGAMKSGTTSLGAYLTAHPEAFCALEPHFFDANFGLGLDWYRGWFKDTGGAAVVGEKSPSYMYHPEAVSRIAQTLPGVKLVAILRNPVDRAYSNYWHYRRTGREKLSFGDALRAEPDRLPSYPPGLCPFAYVDRGLYLPQLERAAEHVPRERLLVQLFDDLERAPAETFAELCAFLGIEGSHVPELVGEKTNTYRDYRPRWLWEYIQKRGLWRFMPARVARALGSAMEKEAEYPPMEPRVRAELIARFAEPNRALGEWLGRDLSMWSA